MSKPKTISIDGVNYVREDSIQVQKQSTDGLPYVCIRTYSAGVHFGFLKRKESTLAGMEVTLVNSIRMRSWVGAMDLSVLSTVGSSQPDKCKPSVEVSSIELVAIEIIPVTDQAFNNIKSMPTWK